MPSELHYSTDLLDRARDLHRRMIVLDSHVDLPATFGKGEEAADRDGPTQFDLIKAKHGGLSGVVLTVAAGAAQMTAEGRAATGATAQEKYNIISDLIDAFPKQVGLALDADGFATLANSGKLAVILGFQNALPLGEDLSLLDLWAKRGVQQFAFTFIGNNQWADSARPYPYIGQGFNSSGLSVLGQKAVNRLNELGVMVDVSQVSAEALRDILATTRAPVIASHSAPRALVDIDRNLTDAELSAIAGSGGVVQVVAFGPYLKPLSPDMMGKIGRLWRQYGLKEPSTLSGALSINDPETADWDPTTFDEFLHEFHVVLQLESPTASVRHLVDAIEHTIGVIGIDHVGIASDFNHSGGVVGWMHAGETLKVTAELLVRGHSEADIAKLWGQNYLRVWREAKVIATG